MSSQVRLCQLCEPENQLVQNGESTEKLVITSYIKIPMNGHDCVKCWVEVLLYYYSSTSTGKNVLTYPEDSGGSKDATLLCIMDISNDMDFECPFK